VRAWAVIVFDDFICRSGDVRRASLPLGAAPGAQWPDEEEEGGENEGLARVEKMVTRIMQNLDRKRPKKGGGKGGASAISDLAGHAQEGGELLESPYFPRIYPERVKDEVSLRSQGGIVGRSPKKIVDLAVNLASNMGKYISFTKVVGKKN